MDGVWRALDSNGRSIITVIASSVIHAREQVRFQLDRPARRWYLEQWETAGEPIVRDETYQ